MRSRQRAALAALAVAFAASACTFIADFPEPSPALSCPDHDDMVRLLGLGVCIDRYEASDVSGVTTSAAGPIPWSFVSYDEATIACVDAGKRLCTPEWWLEACQGQEHRAYPYGDSYEPDRCSDSTEASQVLRQTGELTGCEGGYPGLFDMSGNVAEWVERCDGDSCEARGGSYLSSGDHLSCSSSEQLDFQTQASQVGFRCCLVLP